MTLQKLFTNLKSIAREVDLPLNHIMKQITNMENDREMPKKFISQIELMNKDVKDLIKIENRILEYCNATSSVSDFYLNDIEALVKETFHNRFAEPNNRIKELSEHEDEVVEYNIHNMLNKYEIEFLKDFIRLITDNMAKDVSAGFYASQLAVSHSTLFRKIKTLTGMNINLFIRRVKLENSKKLLRTGIYTVPEVAAKVGINSISYFRLLFKREYGVSASGYFHEYH